MVTNYKFEIKAELQGALKLWSYLERYEDQESKDSFLETFGEPNTWDISEITDFSYLFNDGSYELQMFNSDISNWDVSNGTDFSYMFNNATAFN